METLWLLKGSRSAPGWRTLEGDSKEEKVNLVVFDRDAWAIIKAEEPPEQYEGLVPEEPADGLYVSQQGYPVFVVDKQEVYGPEDVIKALGKEAEELLQKVGDPTVVLQRLGRAF